MFLASCRWEWVAKRFEAKLWTFWRICKSKAFFHLNLVEREQKKTSWWWKIRNTTGYCHLPWQTMEPSKKPVLKRHHYFRDICCSWLLANPFKIGCPSQRVEVDKSVISKWKCHWDREVAERSIFDDHSTDVKVALWYFQTNWPSNITDKCCAKDHLKHFRDPKTVVWTKRIDCEITLKNMCGVHSSVLKSQLDEFLCHYLHYENEVLVTLLLKL